MTVNAPITSPDVAGSYSSGGGLDEAAVDARVAVGIADLETDIANLQTATADLETAVGAVSSCRKSMTSATGIGQSTFTRVPVATLDFEDGDFDTDGDNFITIPADGKYIVFLTMAFEIGANDNGRAAVIASGTYSGGALGFGGLAATTDPPAINGGLGKWTNVVTGPVEFSAGDEVWAEGWCNQSGGCDIEVCRLCVLRVS